MIIQKDGPWHFQNPESRTALPDEPERQWTCCGAPISRGMQTLSEPANMFPNGWYHQSEVDSLTQGFCLECQTAAAMYLLAETAL